MPSRNIIKEYAPDSYYHVYNRGVAKNLIFKNDTDYSVFLSLFKRYLSNEAHTSKYGHPHPHYKAQIELLVFCLMPNHFHLLVYQHNDSKAIAKLVQSICTAYTMYFNRKYKRVGPLFQSRFKASRISSDEYLQHISRYIHLNPQDYRTYKWTSIAYYLNGHQAEWLNPTPILDLFAADNYLKFLEDYEDYKASLDEIKYELANSP